MTNAANAYAIRIVSQNDSGGASKGNLHFDGGNWDTGHIVMNGIHLWSNGTNLYWKTSAPTTATDGTVV